MKKKVFKDDKGNIHFGINAPLGFQEGKKEDVNKALGDLENKKMWRCNVCNDLQISIEPLEECPTCFAKDAYVEIDLNEFKNLIETL
jgi:rubrerythrin